MAVVKFGVIVTDARGKLGGHNFSWNNGGNVLQTNSNNTKRTMQPTSRQQQVSVNTAFVKKIWRTLSTSNRTAWHSAAPNFPKKNKVGNTRLSYGYEYYLRVNNLIVNAGFAPIALPQASVPLSNLGAITTTVIGHVAASISFGSFITADEVIVLSATRCMSLGRKPSNTDLNQIAVIDSNANNPYDFFANYIDVFGDMVPNTQFFVYCYILNKLTGQSKGQYWVVCLPT